MYVAIILVEHFYYLCVIIIEFVALACFLLNSIASPGINCTLSCLKVSWKYSLYGISFPLYIISTMGAQ